MTKQDKKISQFLCYLLRHSASVEVLPLSEEGWAELSDLFPRAAVAGHDIELSDLKRIVAEDDKGRYAFSADGTKIRALQGHSSPMVKMVFAEATPEVMLYHGTVRRFLEPILKEGLVRGDRHYVHLSSDIETAKDVGIRRKGDLVLFAVLSGAMVAQGHSFYLSENNVWLTKHVPPEFLVLL